MQKLFSLFISIFYFTTFISAQCMIEPWTLKKRVDLSDLVVEGKVLSKHSYWEKGRKVIRTSTVVEVYKVFKGPELKSKTIEIVTFGGTLGLEKQQAFPELDPELENTGIFLLINNKVPLPNEEENNGKLKFEGVASVQSMILYDLEENRAFDIIEPFNGITTALYETLQILCERPYTEIKSFGYNPEKLKTKPVAGPVITGFGSSSANSGTGDILTVIGQGFGNFRGNGRIEFINADYGDGRRMKTPYSQDYTVWTDTIVKVRIPTRAGTGSIKIATNDSGSFTTITGFKINYAHLNATYKPSGGDEGYYPTDHINDNNKGGYTFRMNHQFKRNSGMVNAFLRSLETWRCGTLMNWEVGLDTNIKVVEGDKVNIVRLTKYTDSRLAVCYSYWNGCFSGGGNMEWFVVELDIEADSTRNWYYGTGKPASNQYHFQSVLSHELGHGHQLGHVIASQEMMHYSISNGQDKSTLSSNDLTGGTYVKDKSVKINVCSGGRLIALNPNSCNYTSPIAGFKAGSLTVCPGSVITFTDTSLGIVKNYSWNFGPDATPKTASGKGPHNCVFSTSGTKSISLIVSNDFGSDTVTKTDYITVLDAVPSKPSNLKYQDTACLGIATLEVDTPVNASLVWQLPPQASVLGTTINSKRVSWTTSGGPYSFWVKLTNSCGSSDSLTGNVFVYNNPVASFTASENGRTVTFTNTSQYADSYVWQFGDGDSSLLSDPVHVYPAGKPYVAVLKATNRCKTVNSSKTVNPYHPASVTGIELKYNAIFPNPVRDKLYMSKGVSSYELYNTLGSKLSEGSSHELDMNRFENGMYFLYIKTIDGNFETYRITKE